MNHQTDEQLVDELKNGNRAAFDFLFDRYAKKAEYYFYRMLWSNEEKAADFTQDLFLKVLEKIDLYKTEYSFKTWFFSMANNMCKNEYRKEEVKTKANGHLKIVANTISYNGGDLATDQNKFNEVLFKTLDSFSEEKKTAFILKYIDDVPLQEISEILGIPIGTVKSGLHYTTKILAEILKPFKP